jgi:outer membrane protein OmpA-like peptidoglycan-associated protein
MLTYRHPHGGLARVLLLLGALVCTLATAQTAAAQERRYLFEVGAAGSYQGFGSSTDLGGAAGGLGRIGVWLPLNFSLEGEASTSSPKAKTPDVGVGVKTLSVSALYNLPLGTKTWAYGKLGVGKTRYGKDPCSTPTICGTAKPVITGVGFRLAITPFVMARVEGMVNFNKTTSDTGVAPNIAARTTKFSNYGINLGLSLMLGSKPVPDSDGDGVLNNRDRCANTPPGAQVNEFGCPADNDGDGVANGIDRCPNTPVGATVDPTGCTRDSDGDNIPDGIDKCPDTPAGVLVDATGCAKDSDGDGIPDGLDRCSDTPKGATVDALGCPGDEDADGVLDGLDRCPRTSIGATVNAFGCPVGQGGRQPANAPTAQPPTSQPPPAQPPSAAAADTSAQARAARAALGQPAGPLVLEGVTFESGSARLQSGSYVELDSLAKVLIATPGMRIEIGGHTDNSGSPADNQHLSALRADAVRNYLVAKGVPFQQMVARGYGSTVPRTPDTTPRGRAANRRVEIKPLSSGP